MGNSAARALSALVLLAAATTVPGRLAGFGHAPLVADWASLTAEAGAVLLCARRALRVPDGRAAWWALTAATASYALGTATFLALRTSTLGTPTVGNALWLGFYPLAYAGLILLLHGRLAAFGASVRLDGLIAGLAIVALACASAYPYMHDHLPLHGFHALVWFIYPVAALVLLTICGWGVALLGSRSGREWLLLCVAFAVLACGNVAVVTRSMAGHFDRAFVGLAALPVAVALIGAAAGRASRGRVQVDASRVLVLPLACVAVSLGLVLAGVLRVLPMESALPALAAVAAAAVRLALTVGEARPLWESRRFERGFVEATIGMALVSTDLRWLRVNPALCELLGRPERELVGASILEAIHPDDHGITRETAATALDGEPIRSHVKRYVRGDGAIVEARISSAVVDFGEACFFTQIVDETQVRRAERQKVAIGELGRLALESADVGPVLREAAEVVRRNVGVDHSVVWRLSEDESHLASVSISPTDSRWDGKAPLTSQAGMALRSGAPVLTNDLATEARFVVDPRTIGFGVRRALSVPVRERDGARHVLAVVDRRRDRDLGVEDVRFLEAVAVVLGGALDRAAYEAELRKRALEDPLTGLANRALLTAQLQRELAHAARHGGSVGVLLLDVDRFKYINDTLGHGAGDELLREIADRLRARVREEDLVARLGGDEYVVVIRGEDSVADLGRRLLDVFAAPFTVGGRSLHVSASGGVAVAHDGVGDADTLLRDADVAMYRAKDGGGARIEVFDAVLRGRVVARLATENDLRGAAARGELELVYQPLVDLADDGVSEYEALLRWRHPERGMIAPADFIEVAEETGLIVPMGRWVLEQICRRLADSPPGLRLAANLSARQVTDDLVGEVRALLAADGVAPERLVLEITERMVLDPRAVRVVAALRALGVVIACSTRGGAGDEASGRGRGTGYSSLSYLSTLPVDVLKLDRSLTAALEERSGRAVFEASVALARALGLAVVAEGIETDAQLAIARELGCHKGQGFLLGKPAPAAHPARVLRNSHAA
jgi:diguanylate cyclase (GGDEF)-like protein/PAS domain S-box-containing protein